MKDGDPFLRLDQMLDACHLMISFVEGLSEAEFLTDGRTQSAVAMQPLIIGEAAAGLRREHPDFLAKYPDLEWRHMVGMRNRIAHGYADLDFLTIWRTTATEVPELLRRLQTIYIAAGETISTPPMRKPNSD